MSNVTGTPPNHPYPPQDPSGGFYLNQMAPPQPPKRGMSTGAILGIVAAIFAVLCIGGAVAVALVPTPESEPRAAVDATTTTVPTTLPPTTAPPTTAPTAAATTAAPPAGPLTSFKDGTYEIGTGQGQIAPGKYKTTVPGDSFGCYWERLKGTSGQFSDIIANNLAEPNTQTIVTIAQSDKAFSSRGCGTWMKA